MSTIDQIKSKMGRVSIKLASEGMDYSWKMRSGKKSPNYTTSWDGLVVVGYIGQISNRVAKGYQKWQK